MTQQTGLGSESHDPEGSIFLPKTKNPSREYENWKLQLLMGRGVGAGKSYEETMELYEKLQEAQVRNLGGLAVDAV